VAELDGDAQLKDQDAGPSVQQVYLQAAQRLLKKEFGPSAVTQELKGLLEDNDSWLHAVHAPKICGSLGLECAEPPYYRDICVWLPDERWGTESLPRQN
jgi:hypothetical protein